MSFFSRLSALAEEPDFLSWIREREEKPLSELPQEVQLFFYGMYSQKRADELKKEQNMKKECDEMYEFFMGEGETDAAE